MTKEQIDCIIQNTYNLKIGQYVVINTYGTDKLCYAKVINVNGVKTLVETAVISNGKDIDSHGDIVPKGKMFVKQITISDFVSRNFPTDLTSREHFNDFAQHNIYTLDESQIKSVSVEELSDWVNIQNENGNVDSANQKDLFNPDVKEDNVDKHIILQFTPIKDIPTFDDLYHNIPIFPCIYAYPEGTVRIVDTDSVKIKGVDNQIRLCRTQQFNIEDGDKMVIVGDDHWMLKDFLLIPNIREALLKIYVVETEEARRGKIRGNFEKGEIISNGSFDIVFDDVCNYNETENGFYILKDSLCFALSYIIKNKLNDFIKTSPIVPTFVKLALEVSSTIFDSLSTFEEKFVICKTESNAIQIKMKKPFNEAEFIFGNVFKNVSYEYPLTDIGTTPRENTISKQDIWLFLKEQFENAKQRALTNFPENSQLQKERLHLIDSFMRYYQNSIPVLSVTPATLMHTLEPGGILEQLDLIAPDSKKQLMDNDYEVVDEHECKIVKSKSLQVKFVDVYVTLINSNTEGFLYSSTKVITNPKITTFLPYDCKFTTTNGETKICSLMKIEPSIFEHSNLPKSYRLVLQQPEFIEKFKDSFILVERTDVNADNPNIVEIKTTDNEIDGHRIVTSFTPIIDNAKNWLRDKYIEQNPLLKALSKTFGLFRNYSMEISDWNFTIGSDSQVHFEHVVDYQFKTDARTILSYKPTSSDNENVSPFYETLLNEMKSDEEVNEHYVLSSLIDWIKEIPDTPTNHQLKEQMSNYIANERWFDNINERFHKKLVARLVTFAITNLQDGNVENWKTISTDIIKKAKDKMTAEMFATLPLPPTVPVIKPRPISRIFDNEKGSIKFTNAKNRFEHIQCLYWMNKEDEKFNYAVSDRYVLSMEDSAIDSIVNENRHIIEIANARCDLTSDLLDIELAKNIHKLLSSNALSLEEINDEIESFDKIKDVLEGDHSAIDHPQHSEELETQLDYETKLRLVINNLNELEKEKADYVTIDDKVIECAIVKEEEAFETVTIDNEPQKVLKFGVSKCQQLLNGKVESVYYKKHFKWWDKVNTAKRYIANVKKQIESINNANREIDRWNASHPSISLSKSHRN